MATDGTARGQDADPSRVNDADRPPKVVALAAAFRLARQMDCIGVHVDLDTENWDMILNTPWRMV